MKILNYFCYIKYIFNKCFFIIFNKKEFEFLFFNKLLINEIWL